MYFRARVTTLILWLNAAVFVSWMLFDQNMMARHFLVSWQALVEGRVWTLLASEFSHVSFWHIFLNLYVLRSFGPVMETSLGSRAYLAFYLFAAALASLTHSLVSAFLLGAPELPALGASGAISGLVLLFSLSYPQQRILFLFFPVPAIVGAVLLVGVDLWGLVGQARGGASLIGHGAHLGGALAGLLWFVATRRNFRR